MSTNRKAPSRERIRSRNGTTDEHAVELEARLAAARKANVDGATQAPEGPRCARDFETRLRFGKGQRGWFTIATNNAAIALARATHLADAAALLARAGKHEHAKLVLERAAGMAASADFTKALKWIAEYAAGKRQIEAPAPKGATTFQQLAERWIEPAATPRPPRPREEKAKR